MDGVGRVWGDYGAEFVCACGCAGEELPRAGGGGGKLDGGEGWGCDECAANWALGVSECGLCVDGLAVFGGLGRRNV